MEIQDISLVEKLKNGESSAFEMIYRSQYQRIYHFAYQYLHDDEICTNIIQDTFFLLWENRKKLAENTNLNAWIFTVTKNNCLKYIRDLKIEKRNIGNISAQRMVINHEALNCLDTSPTNFNEIERIIEKTLNILPPQCRRAFELSRNEEKKYAEIAAEMQIAQKTVETHITNALKIFRVALKDYLPFLLFLYLL